MKPKTKVAVVILILCMFFSLTACRGINNISYSDTDNWAYFENDKTQKSADVFFICPTVYGGDDTSFNMPINDTKGRKYFLGAINMEKGIYDDNARFFAPYYRQAGLNTYKLSVENREQYLASAYSDVKNAFSYYLRNCNKDRAIILAGFSQGADLCIRLLKDYAKDENFRKKLVACYAIGWSISQRELNAYPGLKFATGETDTGVIVSFNSEAEYIDDSLIIPAGTKTLAINPLNWRTDGTIASKALNLGACFTDYKGNINKEIPQLTGAYIDAVRGSLKVVDVSADEYLPVLDIFEKGVYHLYDYQFFYRNLEKNVQARIDAFENGEEHKQRYEDLPALKSGKKK